MYNEDEIDRMIRVSQTIDTEICELCEKSFDVNKMRMDDEGVWICKECLSGINSDENYSYE